MSILVNRKLLQSLLDSGDPVSMAANRAVGKTTGGILRAIGLSYLKPNEWVLIDDPDMGTTYIRRDVVYKAQRMLASLSLHNIEVAEHMTTGRGLASPIMHGVYIRNTFAERLA